MKLFKIVLVAIAALISLTKAVAGAKDGKLVICSQELLLPIINFLLTHLFLDACFLPDSVNGFGAFQCRAYSAMWSYRATANRCVRFLYGGCGGNRNQFSTQSECENICKK